MPKYPISVKVDAIEYAVQTQKTIVDGTRELMGDISYEKQTIRVCTAYSQQIVASVIWHELMHAVFYQGGHEVSEELVRFLGYKLPEIIAANPALVEITTRGEQSE